MEDPAEPNEIVVNGDSLEAMEAAAIATRLLLSRDLIIDPAVAVIGTTLSKPSSEPFAAAAAFVRTGGPISDQALEHVLLLLAAVTARSAAFDQAVSGDLRTTLEEHANGGSLLKTFLEAMADSTWTF
jgi:hypothetical protein